MKKNFAPVLLNPTHDCSAFSCEEPSLDDWLKNRALKNQIANASRTYVSLAISSKSPSKVVGYYSLAAGSLARELSTGRLSRNMPQPIPVMVLGRLAVDRSYQGQGLGYSLLQDAIARSCQAAEIIGIRAIMVHAISERAKNFYKYFGFEESPVEEMTLMCSLKDLAKSLN